MQTPILQEINLYSICLRAVLAVVVGGILGIERGRKNRPAGFRTYILVCVGAAMVMMTNQYVWQVTGLSDPVRMGSQVISGIGFLGAGTILVTGKNQIRGITTAAGLWTSACCGLAIGIGFYEGALVGGVTIFCVLTCLTRIDSLIRRRSKYIDLYLEFGAKKPFSDFLIYSREHGFDIQDIQLNKNKIVKDQALSVVLSLVNHEKRSHSEVIDVLSGAPGILYIEEV